MRRLKRGRFKDVLSHVDSAVEFGEHLTVFTGLSDSGKSGLMRALNQHMRNLPAGIDLLRHGAGRGGCSDTTLTVEKNDAVNCDIARRRGKSKNEYVLDGQPLLAIGRDVPTEVSDILSLSPHAFQLQSDGNFMLCERDGKVAEMLSKTVGLSQIDAAFAKINKLKTENDTALRVGQADFDRETETLKKFDGLDAVSEAVAEAERVEGELETAKGEIGESVILTEKLAALVPDHNDELVWTSQYLREALRTTKSCEEAVFVSCDTDRLLRSLDAVPADAKCGIATSAWHAALQKQSVAEVAHKIASEMISLYNRMATLPRDATMVARRGALMLTQSKDLAEKLAAVERERCGLDDLLDRLERTKQDCSVELKRVDALCLDESNFEELLRDVTIEIDALLATENALFEIGSSLHTSGAAMTAAASDLEKYMAEHPVCPECGAEQIHWHIHKGE